MKSKLLRKLIDLFAVLTKTLSCSVYTWLSWSAPCRPSPPLSSPLRDKIWVGSDSVGKKKWMKTKRNSSIVCINKYKILLLLLIFSQFSIHVSRQLLEVTGWTIIIIKFIIKRTVEHELKSYLVPHNRPTDPKIKKNLTWGQHNNLSFCLMCCILRSCIMSIATCHTITIKVAPCVSIMLNKLSSTSVRVQ